VGGDLIYVCSALIGEAVGVAETEDGSWQICFFDVPIGVIDHKTRKLRRLSTPVHGNGEPLPQTEPENL
jgi:putative transposase